MEDNAAIIKDLKQRVDGYTVNCLKGIITGLNDQCGTSLNKVNKKNDLIKIIHDQIDDWAGRNRRGGTSLRNAKAVFESMDAHGSYNVTDVSTRLANMSSSSKTSKKVTHRHNLSTPSPVQLQGIPFRFSPFLKIDQHVSGVTVCQGSASSTDRKSVNFDFVLTTDQRNKLASQSPKYELRLYCTSSAYYTKPSTFYPTSSNNPVAVEFPNTCEIRVNNVTLNANTEGVKKKAGTAPPANITREAKTGAASRNKVEMVYSNNQPRSCRDRQKYFLQVNLVQVTTSQQLLEKLKKGKYRSKEEVLGIRKSQSSNHNNTGSSSQEISLRCPLSNLRISTPLRSTKCVHINCFDALTWFSSMEIATTWQCPVCQKKLRHAGLMVDGYVDSILDETPNSVEEVVVESNGAWHTLDNRFHSAGWIPTAIPSPGASSLTSTTRKSSKTMVEGSESAFPRDDTMDMDSNPSTQALYTRGSRSQTAKQEELARSGFKLADEDITHDESLSWLQRGPPPENVTEKIQVKKRIGGGGNSDVWQGTLQTATGMIQVAIKELRMRHCQSDRPHDERLQKRFDREMLVWSKLRHRNIVPLLGFALVPDGLPQLVSPWYSNGTVVEYLRLHPDVNRLQILHDVAEGLNYLHSLPLVHGDIKGENVLVNEEGVASLCDFGLAKFIDDALHITGFTTTNQGNGGTMRFLCPELLEDEPKSTETDIWAFGCLVIQVMTGQYPYADLVSVGAVQTAILRGRAPLPIDYDISKVGGASFWDAIAKCWDVEPRCRPGIAELLSYTFK